MNLKNCALLLNLVLLLSQAAIADEGSTNRTPHLSVVRNDDGLLIEEDGMPVLQYQLTQKSLDDQWPRSNYIHPLYSLDGEVITEDFPDDHKHHRGIFWAWHQVYAGEIRLGDSWVCEDFQWDVEASAATLNADGSATVSAQVAWKSSLLTDAEGTLRAAVRERTAVTVHPATPDYRQIDFDIRLRAVLPNVSIGGSEDDKGYGGFSPRIRLSQEQTFVSSSGAIEPQTEAVSQGPWMDISDAQWGVAILTHPSNPGFPQPWILRRQRSMQNVVFPGRELSPLSMESDTRLRYRILIHRGSASGLDFPQLQQQYGSQSLLDG